MKRFRLVLFLAAFTLSAASTPASASSHCEFRFGFKALHNLIPDIVGECLEDEHYNATGDSVQQTTRGLMAVVLAVVLAMM